MLHRWCTTHCLHEILISLSDRLRPSTAQESVGTLKHNYCQHVLASPDSLNAAPYAMASTVIQSTASRRLSCLLRGLVLKLAPRHACRWASGRLMLQL